MKIFFVLNIFFLLSPFKGVAQTTSISFNSGVAYSYRYLASTSSAYGANYLLNYRNNEEVPQYSFLSELLYNSYKKHITFHMGLSYINYGYSLNASNLKFGDPIFLNGSSGPITSYSLDNLYTFLRVPVKIGYSSHILGIKKHNVFIRAGLALCYLISAKSTTTINNGSQSQENIDMSNLNRSQFNALLELGYDYKWNQFGVQFYLQTNYALTPLNSIASYYKEHLYSISANLGVIYYLSQNQMAK